MGQNLLRCTPFQDSNAEDKRNSNNIDHKETFNKIMYRKVPSTSMTTAIAQTEAKHSEQAHGEAQHDFDVDADRRCHDHVHLMHDREDASDESRSEHSRDDGDEHTSLSSTLSSSLPTSLFHHAACSDHEFAVQSLTPIMITTVPVITAAAGGSKSVPTSPVDTNALPSSKRGRSRHHRISGISKALLKLNRTQKINLLVCGYLRQRRRREDDDDDEAHTYAAAIEQLPLAVHMTAYYYDLLTCSNEQLVWLKNAYLQQLSVAVLSASSPQSFLSLIHKWTHGKQGDQIWLKVWKKLNKHNHAYIDTFDAFHGALNALLLIQKIMAHKQQTGRATGLMQSQQELMRCTQHMAVWMAMKYGQKQRNKRSHPHSVYSITITKEELRVKLGQWLQEYVDANQENCLKYFCESKQKMKRFGAEIEDDTQELLIYLELKVKPEYRFSVTKADGSTKNLKIRAKK